MRAMEPEAAAPEKKRHSPWMWVSGVLALVAIGLLIWGLSVKSDRDSAQKQLSSTQQDLDSTKQQLENAAQPTAEPAEEDDSSAGRAVLAGGALAGAKAVYDDLADQLGATQEDLESTEKELEKANEQAQQAEKDAAAAEQKAKEADNETDKAKAEADQAKAEQQATESKASIAANCAKAYVGALAPLFEGDDPEAQADAVREQVAGITDDCKAALGGK
jgi:chromosome segregation ATPase